MIGLFGDTIYNRLDTENLIEFGLAAEGKGRLESQMILNHKAAIEMLVGEADQVGFNSFTILNLHAVLSENLLADEDACRRLRRRPVNISGSVYQPPAIPQVLEDCFGLLLQKAAAIPDPFEQSFFVMVQLSYLQPFVDVNKRVSRLAANISLIRDNLSPSLLLTCRKGLMWTELSGCMNSTRSTCFATCIFGLMNVRVSSIWQ